MDLNNGKCHQSEVTFRGSSKLTANGDNSSSQNGVFCFVSNGTKSVSNCTGRKPIVTKPRPSMNGVTAVPETETEPFIPTRLQLLTDLANLCTLTGAILATIAMACMWKRRFYLGMFLNALADLADILDGPIARSTTNRQAIYSTIGSKLDCYSDTVSHFVVPASLLMNISDLHPVCVALASLYICAGILRQSYFEVTGRCDNGTCIFGVTSDYMVAIYCVTMHLSPIIGSEWIVLVLGVVFIFMMFACLTFSLRSRRYEGVDLIGVTLFNILLCFSCLLLVFYADQGDFRLGSAVLFASLLLLAYPLYFRFVEINR